MRRRPLAHALAIAALAAGCRQTTTTGPTPPAAPAATITITAAGVDSQQVDIPLGGRVLFVNLDSRSHHMASDPHPDHTDCPGLNQVGFMLPGQSRETGNFVTARSCAFHDHDDPDDQRLRGRITIR